MDDEQKGPSIFGKDLSEIPCFRNSWLYGISGGTGTGLLYFLFTSKPQKSCHVGFSTMIGVTMSYWIYCRYQHSRTASEIQRMKEYVEKRTLMDGTEMEKLHTAEVVNVSHTAKKDP